MKAETQKIMNEMVEVANQGKEVMPFMWQSFRGINASVSAAVRAAKKRGLLVQGGVDGVGNPFYVAPIKAVPAVTHNAPATLQ